MDIYAENIMDHYKHPHNKGTIIGPDVVQKEFNPLCGDEVEMQLKIIKGSVYDIKFNGKGCAISQASATLTTDLVKGKSIEELKNITRDDIIDLLGIPIGPVRLKCALLSFHAIQNAIKKLEEHNNDTKN